jgi:Right handed beta helix region
MRDLHRRRMAIVAGTLLAALAFARAADAQGVINITSCQTLSIPNTVYRLTADLSSSGGDCLTVAADRITIDLQGHSITGPGVFPNRAIGDDSSQPRDVIVIKNGTVSGFAGDGIGLHSRRVSVISVTANNNEGAGIAIFGEQSLVKSSTASFNEGAGIALFGHRAQVEQSTANKNTAGGIITGPNCLVTRNTANENLASGIDAGHHCTVSHNTANDNDGNGIDVVNGSLVTRNTATNNSVHDFVAICPATVTYNTSTNGFPASYDLTGTGCHTVGND